MERKISVSTLLKPCIVLTTALLYLYIYIYVTRKETVAPKNIIPSTNRKFVKDKNCTSTFRANHLMTSIIRGRIGNHLFAVSTLIAAANESCYRPFLSQNLSMEQYIEIRNMSRTNFTRANFRVVSEKGWGKYDGSIAQQISRKHNVTISGYRESYKYFNHKADLVRSSFVFKQEIQVTIKTYFEEHSLFSRTKVGLHVRRGDFLAPNHKLRGYVSSSLVFILRAMLYFEHKLKNKNIAFIVVSDGIQWCKDNILAPNTYFPSFNDPGKDLYILTQCDHNIVTTGTYGWMGAWLNETGTVVYDKSFPRVNSMLWTQQRKEDVFPPWWIGL